MAQPILIHPRRSAFPTCPTRIRAKRYPPVLRAPCGALTTIPAALRLLARTLDLSAYKPLSKGLETFSILDKRLDWILISPELEFVSYEVLPDIISDHLGVCAEITMKAIKNSEKS